MFEYSQISEEYYYFCISVYNAVVSNAGFKNRTETENLKFIV